MDTLHVRVHRAERVAVPGQEVRQIVVCAATPCHRVKALAKNTPIVVLVRLLWQASQVVTTVVTMAVTGVVSDILEADEAGEHESTVWVGKSSGESLGDRNQNDSQGQC